MTPMDIDRRGKASQYYQEALEESNHSKAIELFDRAIELNPAFAEAYCHRGISKDELGDHSGAIFSKAGQSLNYSLYCTQFLHSALQLVEGLNPTFEPSSSLTSGNTPTTTITNTATTSTLDIVWDIRLRVAEESYYHCLSPG